MQARGRVKERLGVVINNKSSKVIMVRIDRTAKHSKYKRTIRMSTKVMVHDEKNEAKLNDRVRIQETRPLSKNKRWRLVEVLK